MLFSCRKYVILFLDLLNTTLYFVSDYSRKLPIQSSYSIRFDARLLQKSLSNEFLPPVGKTLYLDL